MNLPNAGGCPTKRVLRRSGRRTAVLITRRRSLRQQQLTLDAHLRDLPAHREKQHGKRLRHEGFQVRPAVAVCMQQDDHEPKTMEILPELKPLIHRDEGVVFTLTPGEQGVVIQVSPSSRVNRVRIVVGQPSRQPARQIAVEDDADFCSGRGRVRDKGALRQFQHRNRTRARHTRDASRNTSIESPASRDSIKVCTGTRVPARTGVPPSRSGDAEKSGSGRARR